MDVRVFDTAFFSNYCGSILSQRSKEELIWGIRTSPSLVTAALVLLAFCIPGSLSAQGELLVTTRNIETLGREGRSTSCDQRLIQPFVMSTR